VAAENTNNNNNNNNKTYIKGENEGSRDKECGKFGKEYSFS
jgi:hypothetical protein